MNQSFDIGQSIKSGLIVALIAIPLCLGIALASNAPLISGLIAGIVGGIVVGLISNSPISVSGPAAGLTSIIYQGISEVGSFQIFTYAIIIAGFIQIILSITKSSKVANYLPMSAIEGMMAGIGFILIMKQIPFLLGTKNYIQVQAIFAGSPDIHTGALIIGIISFLLYSLSRTDLIKKNKFFKIVPYPLVLVVTSSLIALLFIGSSNQLYPEDYSHISTHISSYVPFSQFSVDGLKNFLNPSVIKYAVLVALVASIESLLCIEGSDNLDKSLPRTNKDRELLAQGAGNIVSGIFGGLAVTSVIVRTSANFDSGARSKYSAIVHGLFILVSIVFLAKLIDLIPLGALASILILTGYNLAHPRHFKKMWSLGMEEFIPFVCTIIGVVFIGLLQGVLIGLVLSIILKKINAAKVAK